MIAPDRARQLWTLFEAIHAVTYFAPQARAAFEAAALPGFWRGYFAGRAAPLGPVGPAPVTALFFTFAPEMVARALPDVWTRATPADALRARQEGAVAALESAYGDVAAGVLDEAVGGLEAAVEGLDCSGRALAAANAALPRPDQPIAGLWRATTVLREHRGDGHVASLVTAGVDGCEALVWRAAHDHNRHDLQPFRGWTDDAWEDAQQRLADRGWLGADGSLTPAGRDAHRQVEALTDEIAAAPWRALGAGRIERLASRLLPLAEAAAGFIRYPNPIGVPRPAATAVGCR